MKNSEIKTKNGMDKVGIKEIIKECTRNFKQDFKEGGNPLEVIGFECLMELIFQAAQQHGIALSKKEILEEVIKELSSPT